MLTVFHYRYRDADNFKAHGSVKLNGVLSETDLRAIQSRFSDGDLFIAEQIDVPPLYNQLQRWSGGPTDADHCWHEFVGVEREGSSEFDLPAQTAGDAKAFLDRLLLIEHWDESMSHFNRDEDRRDC